MDLWTLRLSAKADAVDPIYAKNTDHEYEMVGITKRPVDTALTRVARTRVGITRDGSLIQHEYKCVTNPARRNTNALGTEANYSSLANTMSSRYPIYRPYKTNTDDKVRTRTNSRPQISGILRDGAVIREPG